MSSSTLTKWCGLAAMLGAVLWALWAVVVQSVGWGESGSAAYERYELINRLLPLALLPVVVGFVGLHAAQRRRYGWLGTTGFVVVLGGFAIILVGSAGEFWAFTEQGYAPPNLRDTAWTLFLLAFLLAWLGYLLWSGKYESGQQLSRVR